MRRRLAWLVLAVCVLVGSPALADSRVALVIGNASYRHAPSLPNPPRDAAAMAEALRKVGFTTVEVRADQGKAQMEAALKTFAQSARGADVAVIYYAGHSLEQGGLNYLVPVDATLATDADVEFEAIPLKLLERTVEGATRLKLIVLDACRNNPFLTTMRRTSATRAVGRGLARVEPEGDILIAYAAREGAVASDGDASNSPYTTALVRRLSTPGLEIRILFGQVRDDVLAATGRAQEPAIYGSLGGDPFYFVPPAGGVPTARAAAPDASVVELAFWQSASAGNDRGQLQAYLDKYPQGEFASLARAKIAALGAPTGPAGAATAEDRARGLRVFGMVLSPLDSAARARLRVPAGLNGAGVEAVEGGSEAAAQGVRPGDVITHVGTRPVIGPAAVFNAARMLGAQGRRTAQATVFRDGSHVPLTFNVPAAPQGALAGGPAGGGPKPPRAAPRSAPR